MTPLSRLQTIAGFVVMLCLWAAASDDDYTHHIFVADIISASTEQALGQPRVEMVALGEVNE